MPGGKWLTTACAHSCLYHPHYHVQDGSDGAATALKYEDGQLVLFDGGLTHRTEPYEHANGMRILAVLDCYSETDQEAVRMVGQERGNGFCRMLNLNNNACPGK